MAALGAIGFTAPWLLAALAALPVLWWLLRATPPAPVRRRFPGVALLLGLEDRRAESDRTPWWLLALRIAAAAALIVGFAGPVLNPDPRAGAPQDMPLLIVVDASWASARDWPRRTDRIETLLADAARAGRPAAIVPLTDPPQDALPFRPAGDWREALPGIAPRPWVPRPDEVADWAGRLGDTAFETVWLSDGLARQGREALLDTFAARGPVTVIDSDRPVFALRPPRFEEGEVRLTALRSPAETAGEADLRVVARGADPSGVERELGAGTARFAPGAAEAETEIALQPELRNRATRFVIAGARSAGAVSLTDDGLARRTVALLGARDGRERVELLSQTYYLRQALTPGADLIDGTLDDILLASPDVIILADVAQLAEIESDRLLEWVEAGGLLLRFAGPRLAASDVSRGAEDPLMPVRLRAGGRSIGGAMSWGEPRRLRPFGEDSPFQGLSIPDDVAVNSQVLAQPDPRLDERAIAALADGTPLVTQRHEGLGRIVLFHVTANAEWSTLPLSGLFVAMLERLAIATRPSAPEAEDLAGTTWEPAAGIDAFGAAGQPARTNGVAGEELAAAIPAGDVHRALPPGLYARQGREIALNVTGPDSAIAPADWPAGVPVEGLETARERPIAGPFLAGAFVVLLADILAVLWLSGRLRRASGAACVALALALAPVGGPAEAQDDASDDRLALRATTEVVLAHVLTGDTRVDELARAGLRGLSRYLTRRSAVEPGTPIGVDIERDELAFFPFLYWPVTADQPLPSDAAYGRLNRYLRGGGLILFDTRDADIAELGMSAPAGRRLQEIARPLDVPPLEQIPEDHVLTRAFYLLQDFPGRHDGPVWVEAAPADAERAEGMPFRDLNDGVSPVIIGGNDWAAAWAVDEQGRPLRRVGRGAAGERQREIAIRFGINLIMHVLTGNYKSDQVHVPALLDRLGQ